MITTERLRALRKEHNWKQKEVADMLGTHVTTYTKYETGKSEPPYDMLVRLAGIFEVSTDYLLELTDSKEKVSTEKSVPIHNVIKIAGRDGSMFECTVSDGQRDFIKQMLENLKPVDDEDV